MKARIHWSALAVVAALLAAACGSADGATDAGPDPEAPAVRSEPRSATAATVTDQSVAGAGTVDSDGPDGSTAGAALVVTATGSPSPLGTTARDPAASSDPSTTTAPASGDAGSSSTASAGVTPSSTAPAGVTPSSTASAGVTPSSTAATTGHGNASTSAPSTVTTAAPPTTSRPTTSRPPTTAPPTTRPTGGGGVRFATLPPGSALPSGDACAARVRPAPEVRAGNAGYNGTRGTGTNDRYPRVDGNFTGTTDEIIQWAACKWGIDEDWARAQMAKESWWDMSSGGDRNDDQSACHPQVRTSSGPCPESMGLGQVRYIYHREAFEDANAIRSTAYNVDYTYAVWRACFEGELTWLNNVERGRQYTPGDLEGCLGVWFTGRWYIDRAIPYIDEVRRWKNERIWEHPNFLGYG
ncbi:MAG: hypothetical protein AAGA93_22565 [Actinomycetota bacterium]